MSMKANCIAAYGAPRRPLTSSSNSFCRPLSGGRSGPTAEPEGSQSARRYSPARFQGCTRELVKGAPDIKLVSTSFAERQNLTMRMHMRRFTRLANTFSKKIENHFCAVALHAMYYNFVRIHQTLRVTPAIAAGVTDRVWEMTDLVEMREAFEAREQPA
jgi:hypothetical protein